MLVGHNLLKLFSYQAKLHLHFINNLLRHLEGWLDWFGMN